MSKVKTKLGLRVLIYFLNFNTTVSIRLKNLQDTFSIFRFPVSFIFEHVAGLWAEAAWTTGNNCLLRYFPRCHKKSKIKLLVGEKKDLRCICYLQLQSLKLICLSTATSLKTCVEPVSCQMNRNEVPALKPSVWHFPICFCYLILGSEMISYINTDSENTLILKLSFYVLLSLLLIVRYAITWDFEILYEWVFLRTHNSWTDHIWYSFYFFFSLSYKTVFFSTV